MGCGDGTKEDRAVPMYHKTNIIGLQKFLWEKFPWANNGNSIEDIWKNFKSIVMEGIEVFVPHKTLKQNPDLEFYNKEVKHLKRKVRKAYSRRKQGEEYIHELKQLSQKLLLSVKRKAQETYLHSLLQNEGNSWAEFYRYVKRREGNKETIPMIRDCNGEPITDPVEKANILNNYYASVFSHERDIPVINSSYEYEPFTVKVNTIRKRSALI